jgi:hypothetical protein
MDRFGENHVNRILSKKSSRKQICRLEKGKTTDYDSYVDETFKPLIGQLEENKLKFGCQVLVIVAMLTPYLLKRLQLSESRIVYNNKPSILLAEP